MAEFIKAGERTFLNRADRDIERNRKGNFKITLSDSEKKPTDKKAVVRARLKRLDYDFGANIFMLGEYDSTEKNRLYEEYFCKIFNSAAVPLYWEGTEPVKDYLRYAKGTPRDIYRRPPADEVVEFCEAKSIKMKGHPLFWHEFVAPWLPENYTELKPYILKRFEEISERYSKKIAYFDVVNEPSRIYDVHRRDLVTKKKHLVPEDDYCVWLFDLANRLFPANKLILNDTVGAAFDEFRGKYSGFYLNIKDLLSRGVRIDEIGMQCHLGENGSKNVYNTEVLYDVLDTYADLGKTINISEISIPSKIDGVENEELQALAAERLYKAVFSHPATTGITWWNMPDDGILTTKRVAGNENLPSTGLIDGNYRPKKAYEVLDRLINSEWTTDVTVKAENSVFEFCGFYGKYVFEIETEDGITVKEADLSKCMCEETDIVV